MSEILETYQEEASLDTEDVKEICYATVKSISSSGMIVRFDGESSDSTKAYSFNVAGQFQVNDRVIMQKVNGEYVAMASIGKSQRSGSDKRFVIATKTFTNRSVSANSVYHQNASIEYIANYMGIVGIRTNNVNLMGMATMRDNDPTANYSHLEYSIYNPTSASISATIYIDYLTWE